VTGENRPRRKVLESDESIPCNREEKVHRELTSAALRIPSNQKRLAFNGARPDAWCRSKRVIWTNVGHMGAYGVFTIMALTVDPTAERRATTESNFISVQ
jgi:hypothetical protein